ncbi:MAG: hypothetical protein FJ009_15240 [Chloroflexi bacterium]|nr:hypothetical protein [Chloroflexota bacterium]
MRVSIGVSGRVGVGVGIKVGVKVGVGVGVSVGVGVNVGVAVSVAVGVGEGRNAPAILTTAGCAKGSAATPNPRIATPAASGSKTSKCLEFITPRV